MLPIVLPRRRRLLLLLSPSPRCHLFPFLFSSNARRDDGGPSAKPIPIAEHLVTRWGISAAKALTASKHLAHLKSTERPDSVLTFLRSQGFDSSHIDRIIGGCPGVLRSNAEKTLAPKLRCLRDLGFSEAEVTEIVALNPIILRLGAEGKIIPKFQFWKSFFGSRERMFAHLKRKVSFFLSSSIEKRINPNVKFLMDECGVPEERVFSVARKNAKFIVSKPDSLRSLIARVDEIGVPRRSTTFLSVMFYLSGVGRDKLNAKLKLMTSFGWSKSELLRALEKAPNFLCISENKLQKNMKFLVEEVGCDPSSIAQHPLVLTFSLEKRTIPRVRVMEMLHSKGLAAKDKALNFLFLPQERFLEKFVRPHIEKVPDLLHILGSSEMRPTPLVLEAGS